MDQSIDLHKILIRCLMIVLLAIAAYLHVYADNSDKNSANQEIHIELDKPLPLS